MGLFAGTPFDLPPRCERCQAIENECRCPPLPPKRTPPDQQTVRVKLEKRQRGKMVTTVSDLSVAEAGDAVARAELLTMLKATCGAGGTLKDLTIEIQGEHVQRIRQALLNLGYRVKI